MTATEMYSNTRTLWVEPVTGSSSTATRSSTRSTRPTVTTGRQDRRHHRLRRGHGQQERADWGAKASLLSFIDNWLLLVGLVLGFLLVGLGAYLLLTPRSSEDGAYATAPPADRRVRTR